MSKPQNPLASHFRREKLFIKLPSNGHYYSDDVVELLEDGTVGIKAMTGADELSLKNPDALLNGEALVSVIQSCVPAIKNVKSLLANDVDAIMTAIRYVSYGDKLESSCTCPVCSHVTQSGIDLSYALDNMEYLEPGYSLTLNGGIVVNVKPHGYSDLLRSLKSKFEQSKITRSLESDKMTDEAKMAVFSEAFIFVAKNTQALLLSAISNIVVSGDGDDVTVTDKKFISEYLDNTERSNISQLEDLIAEINSVGIKRDFTSVCEKCAHTWETRIDFNPVNFS